MLGRAVFRLAGAAQHGADARQQLSGVERLGDVIIRPQFQPDDAIGFLGHGGEHDDRHIGFRAEPAGEIQPALPRQHQIQHHELVMPIHEGPARFLAIARGGHPQAVALQELGQQVADFAVVIDDKDMRQRFHGCYNNGAISVWAGQVAIRDNLPARANK
jgi:hypothetical protein